MASSTLILALCNAALAELGGGAVEGGLLASTADLSSPATDLETTVAARLDEALMEVLSDYGWKSVSTREKLLASGTAPIVEFKYAYAFPVDTAWLSLRINKVWINGFEIPGNAENNWYTVEGGYLLSDYTNIHLSFIRYPNLTHAAANNSTWDSFITAIKQNAKLYSACVAELGHKLSYNITGGSAHQDRLKQDAMDKLSRARGWESRNGRGLWYGSKELIYARYR